MHGDLRRSGRSAALCLPARRRRQRHDCVHGSFRGRIRATQRRCDDHLDWRLNHHIGYLPHRRSSRTSSAPAGPQAAPTTAACPSGAEAPGPRSSAPGPRSSAPGAGTRAATPVGHPDPDPHPFCFCEPNAERHPDAGANGYTYPFADLNRCL